MNTDPSAVPCPVCATLCMQAQSYTAYSAAAHFCPPTRNPDRHARLMTSIKKLWGKDLCSIYYCPECGFGFGYPFIGGDEEFYGILHEQKNYPKWRWDYDFAIEKALQPMGGGRILEIGAGVGMFLRSLDSKWSCFALEGSEKTRAELRKINIQTFPNLEMAIASNAGTFQAVVLFQVLEHISQFKEVLDSSHKLLQKGGRITLTVPDVEAMIRQEKLTGCADMPPNHICKWSQKSLIQALRKAGFEPECFIYEKSSWKNVFDALHMTMMSDAMNPKSLAAFIYQIPNKPLRVIFLALLAPVTFLKLLPHLSELRLGGAFGITAVAR